MYTSFAYTIVCFTGCNSHTQAVQCVPPFPAPCCPRAVPRRPTPVPPGFTGSGLTTCKEALGAWYPRLSCSACAVGRYHNASEPDAAGRWAQDECPRCTAGYVAMTPGSARHWGARLDHTAALGV